MTQPGLTLVLGGTRSGKSAWAEQLAERMGGTVGYVATAEVRDDEMRARVIRHQSRRSDAWRTVEAPRQAAQAITDLGRDVDVILVDCLTLFVSNWLLHDETAYEGDALIDEVLDKVDELIQAAEVSPADVIVVSNEVGSGIVPAYPLGRTFRDLAGLANQRVARVAERVYWTVAGIPVDVKALRADR